MKVSDLHPRSIIDISKEDSLREAARHLADDDIEPLPYSTPQGRRVC